MKSGLDEFSFPALLKARRDAYDGRGNFQINTSSEIQAAFDFFGQKNTMLEKFVPFKMEVSVITARNTKGDIRAFPTVENIHENNILRQTVAPARVSDGIAAKAGKIAEKTLSVLKGSGVFGIEMFVTQDDDILINEIAPRVHNSGHHTLQSSETSQFEQHLRAILGMELGGTRLLYPTVMYNILGPMAFQGEYEVPKIDEHGVFLKMYGKKTSKPSRKMGHINIVGSRGQTIDSLLERMDSIKSQAVIKPKKTD